MRVLVNGERLYVDVEGAGLVPDGPVMREKPTVVLVHGGPGSDHSWFKPAFSALADIAQLVYYDHRGNGRSTGSDPAAWTLAQWADDLKGLCDALGIAKPIVYGVSFGGFVVQAYAIRHPDHPAKIVLASTAAHIDYEEIVRAFERRGGVEARRVAETYWRDPTPERRLKYMEACLPLYRVRPADDPDVVKRAINNHAVAVHFNGPRNEHGRMDFRAALKGVACPVLVLAGEDDPIIPPVLSDAMVASLPPHLVRYERLAGCGHGIMGDAPDRGMRLLRDFILGKG
jgi:pimeloyl-ACP methyl ester carboxylesterase